MANDNALVEVCGLLLREPERIIQYHCHRRRSTPWSNKAHHHEDLVQFDLIEGFKGKLRREDRRVLISGTMAFVMYPGVRHQYDLMPVRRTARLFSFKLRLPPDLQLLKTHYLPEIDRDPRNSHALIETLLRIERLTIGSRRRTPLLAAMLAEVLLLWPRGTKSKAEEWVLPDWEGTDYQHVERAIAFVEDSVDRPVSVKDMARRTGLSSRQLERRFRATMGLTPHMFIESRRLIVAKEALADKQRTTTEVAESLGFPSIHTFSRWFTRLTGQSPSRYRTTPDRF